MKRGRKRSPNSRHQLCMRTLFGDAAENIPSDHLKWPEPYYGIYNRMLKDSTVIAYADELSQYPSTEVPENHHV